MDSKSTFTTEEQEFRKMADNYLKCFIDRCPQHEQCLRWLVGRYANRERPTLTMVNPLNRWAPVSVRCIASAVSS